MVSPLEALGQREKIHIYCNDCQYQTLKLKNKDKQIHPAAQLEVLI